MVGEPKFPLALDSWAVNTFCEPKEPLAVPAMEMVPPEQKPILIVSVVIWEAGVTMST